jgi:uncharacterized protein YoxC
MVTIVDVCMIIITLALVSLIAGLIFVLLDVRKMRSTTEEFMQKIEHELTPVLSNVERISGDLSAMSTTIRQQVEKVDLTATNVNKNVNSVVDQWTRTATLLHDAVDDSVVDIAAFIRGVSRGVKFFFNNGRTHKLR